MIQLSRYLGFFPHGECNSAGSIFDLREGVFTDRQPAHLLVLNHEDADILYRLMNAGFENYREVPIPANRLKHLLDALVMYFEIHHTHGNPIRSHTILGEVLN
jgi:DNA repair protein RecO (recombination protein O)